MRALVHILLVGIISIGAIGCGVGSIEGTVKGKSLDVADGVVMTGDQFFGSFGAPNAGVVILTSTDGLCTDFSKGALPKDATAVVIILFQTDADKKSVPLEPGEYKWTSSSYFAPAEANAKTASVEWFSTNGECKKAEDASMDATAGSVKVESVNVEEGGAAAGTFTLSFGSDSIKGSFNVNKCDSVIPKTSEQVCE